MKKLMLSISLILCGFVQAKEPYNFVMFLVDDLGWADVSPNNPNTFYETPNIQKLADQGVNFPQAYAPNPVCSPSRYGIQTGLYPSRGKVTQWIGSKYKKDTKFWDSDYIKGFQGKEITIAKLLQKQGYKTFIAGKWHLGDTNPKDYGYEFGACVDKMGIKPNKYFPPFRAPDFAKYNNGEYLPEVLTDATIDFIKKNKSNKFFVFHSFFLVHTPLQCKPELIKKYEDKAKALGLNPEGDWEEVYQVRKTSEKRLLRTIQSEPTYSGMMQVLDESVGRIVNTIEDLKLAHKTVIIFVSDNGGLANKATCNKPLRAGKGFVYEGGVRVPMIIKIPDIKPNGEIYKEMYVSSIDILPTICDLAGIKINHKIDGVSIMPIIKGDKDFKHPDLFWNYPHYSDQGGVPGGGIRSGDWKLVESYEDGSVELFNVKNDIGEKVDLSKQNPEKVQELKKKLHAWYKDVDATFLQGINKDKNQKVWKPE